MPITITLTLLPIFLGTLEDPVPDLCTEDVYLHPDDGVPIVDSHGTTLSRYCVWTGDDAPVWADEVCCEIGPDSAHCTPTNTLGGCSAAQVKRWCDYAEVDGDQVICLQPFPSACDAGVCSDLPVGLQPLPWVPMCCVRGYCWELESNEFCGGAFSWCESPFTSSDGTLGCADDD